MKNDIVSFGNGDFKVIHAPNIDERKESIIRQQTILMINRNLGNKNKINKVMRRFIKCIKEG